MPKSTFRGYLLLTLTLVVFIFISCQSEKQKSEQEANLICYKHFQITSDLRTFISEIQKKDLPLERENLSMLLSLLKLNREELSTQKPMKENALLLNMALQNLKLYDSLLSGELSTLILRPDSSVNRLEETKNRLMNCIDSANRVFERYNSEMTGK
ncbi:MAG: hypothetical protein LWX70_05585 [Sphingobacteriia bacterium]|nr:hypothetical protein [Sphingobacteriia bacterium]